MDRFLKALLRERGETLAIHDTRFRGKDPDEAGEFVVWDPFLFGIAIDRNRITLRNYFGGHMMYLHEPSLKALSSNIRGFIRGE